MYMYVFAVSPAVWPEKVAVIVSAEFGDSKGRDISAGILFMSFSVGSISSAICRHTFLPHSVDGEAVSMLRVRACGISFIIRSRHWYLYCAPGFVIFSRTTAPTLPNISSRAAAFRESNASCDGRTLRRCLNGGALWSSWRPSWLLFLRLHPGGKLPAVTVFLHLVNVLTILPIASGRDGTSHGAVAP